MKKLGTVIFALFVNAIVYSQSIPLILVEKSGIVDIKTPDDKLVPLDLKINDEIPSGVEIFTGIHSQISIRIGESSYITANQLTRLVFDPVISKDGLNRIGAYLFDGYVVVLSKREGKTKNRILISFDTGNVAFENSSGELFFRVDKGTIIKIGSGFAQVKSKILNFYTIGKNEVCGINEYGKLIESDFFLRNKINTISNNMKEREIDLLLNLISAGYTEEFGRNDYGDYNKP
jgi:hypothetical protein